MLLFSLLLRPVTDRYENITKGVGGWGRHEAAENDVKLHKLSVNLIYFNLILSLFHFGKFSVHLCGR
jgi:hypothetical protein